MVSLFSFFLHLKFKIKYTEEEIRPHKPEDSNSPKKQRKIKIIESPPFSLCLKYLQCQKDAHQMRVNCSKTSNVSFVGIENYSMIGMKFM